MTKAIIWIASSDKYIQEAVVSARSAKRHNSEISQVLCTEMTYSKLIDSMFGVLIKLPDRQYSLWYLDSTSYLLYALARLDYDQILLLDTDTYICDDLSDYFTVLDRFDIVGTHAPGRETAPTTFNIPASFPDLHIGAMAFNNNDKIKALFQIWLDMYLEGQETYKENDQAPLRDALWACKDISVYAMPPEFCFRFLFGAQLRGKVKVLHGRSNKPYEQIEEEVNREWRKIRVFGRGHFR